MPNWCSNSLTLYIEDDAKADAFEEALKGISVENEDAPGLLGVLRPRPKEFDEQWYGWNVDHWGTKWDVYHFEYYRDGNTFDFTFDTAWSPPTALYEYLESEEGGEWTVYALYAEPGMAFVGEYSDGFDNFCEYDFEDENWRDNLTEDMIDFAGLDTSYDDWLEWQDEEDDDA